MKSVALPESCQIEIRSGASPFFLGSRVNQSLAAFWFCRPLLSLSALPLSFFSWLRSGSGGAMDANMRRALDVLLAPPPAPPPMMKASTAPPPPRDEL